MLLCNGKKKIQRTNIDFGLEMISQLDIIASKLNISRQAVVKMAMQDYLTRYHTGELAFKKTKLEYKSRS